LPKFNLVIFLNVNRLSSFAISSTLTSDAGSFIFMLVIVMSYFPFAFILFLLLLYFNVVNKGDY